VGLAYADAGVPTAAVVACPNLAYPVFTGHEDSRALGSLFLAAAGRGAWVEALPLGTPESAAAAATAPPRHRIHVAGHVTRGGDAVMAGSWEPSHSDQSIAAGVVASLGITAPPLRLDSMAKYGLLARGEATLLVRFPKPDYAEKVWDQAAGYVLVREAGGTVTDAFGAPLDFTRGATLSANTGVVASNGALHAAVLAAVAAANPWPRPS